MIIHEMFRSKISEEIARIEKESAVEIVPVIAAQSSSYRFYRTAIALFLALMVALILPAFSWSFSRPWQVGLASFFTLLLGYWVLGYAKLLHLFVPTFYKKWKVEARAQKVFFEKELFATRDRSALLIFLSLAEKSVYIFADKGFEGRIHAQTWIELSSKLAQDFNRKKPGDTFLEALASMKADLARHFPIREGDQNELADAVVFLKD